MQRRGFDAFTGLLKGAFQQARTHLCSLRGRVGHVAIIAVMLFVIVLVVYLAVWVVAPSVASIPGFLRDAIDIDEHMLQRASFLQFVLDVPGSILAFIALPMTILSLWYARVSLDNADEQLRRIVLENDRHLREVVRFDDFPDPVFRAYLRDLYNKQHYLGDSPPEGEPSPEGFTEEDLHMVTEIYTGEWAVTSLEGIGVFRYLEELNCSGSLVERVDVSGLKRLSHLTASDCRHLRIVRCSGCEQLSNIHLERSGVIELNCSQTKAVFGMMGCEETLERLTCRSVAPDQRGDAFDGLHLREIDLDMFPLLKELDCSDNEITRIRAKRASQLQKLIAYKNGIGSIDASACKRLEYLTCSLAPGIDPDAFRREVSSHSDCASPNIVIE